MSSCLKYMSSCPPYQQSLQRQMRNDFADRTPRDLEMRGEFLLAGQFIAGPEAVFEQILLKLFQ